MVIIHNYVVLVGGVTGVVGLCMSVGRISHHSLKTMCWYEQHRQKAIFEIIKLVLCELRHDLLTSIDVVGDLDKTVHS